MEERCLRSDKNDPAIALNSNLERHLKRTEVGGGAAIGRKGSVESAVCLKANEGKVVRVRLERPNYPPNQDPAVWLHGDAARLRSCPPKRDLPQAILTERTIQL